MRKRYLIPTVFYAVSLAMFSLSLQDDWDLEIFVSQTTHTVAGKVSKDHRVNHGAHGIVALAASALLWNPSFRFFRLTIAGNANAPHLLLIRTAAIRAPPLRSLV